MLADSTKDKQLTDNDSNYMLGEHLYDGSIYVCWERACWVGKLKPAPRLVSDLGAYTWIEKAYMQ